jgi:hypothetical protein
MTLLLDRLYFIKARYSIEEAKQSRRDAREELQQFTARLQPRLSIANIGDGDGSWLGQPAGWASVGAPDACMDGVPHDMRELRLDYQVAQPCCAPAVRVRTAEFSVD